MKTLVAGAAEFIGLNVCDALLALGDKVGGLDNLSGGITSNASFGVSCFFDASIQNYELIVNLFKEHHFDYVYHLAAFAARGLSHFIRRFNYKNKLVGIINLINQSILHEVWRFVFTSSIEVYGANQLSMREDPQPIPEDPYGISKSAVELDAETAYDYRDCGGDLFAAAADRALASGKKRARAETDV